MTEGATHIRGDELLARVLAGDEWGSGVANDLLNEFFCGYPIEKLTTLLRSDNERALQSGAWIASELAQAARPILGDLIRLLDSPDVRVKYYVIGAVLTAASVDDQEVTARAVSLITDSEPPIRRASFELSARADSAVLAACLSHIADHRVAALLRWALEVESESRDTNEIALRLREPDGLGRLFAIVAAARIYRSNPHYLQLAASMGESDAQTLAASELTWLSKSQQRELGR